MLENGGTGGGLGVSGASVVVSRPRRAKQTSWLFVQLRFSILGRGDAMTDINTLTAMSTIDKIITNARQ